MPLGPGRPVVSLLGRRCPLTGLWCPWKDCGAPDQRPNHVKKVVRNASQGRLVGGGAALFKGAPMPKCTILKMQHSTGDRGCRRPLANRSTR